MKQIIFLLLFPCLALAQYQGNGNQKITLGEQTTADGLVYRGVASIDTVTATSKITRANKQDTSAFLLLDTVTNLLWHYKTASNGWIQAGGGVSVSSFSAGTTGLTPSTATTGAVTLGGTLAVANGGTNASTFTEGSVVFAGASGTYTEDNSGLFYNNTNNRLGIGITSPSAILDVVGANTTDKLNVSTYTTGQTGSNIRLKHARGTVASPTTLVNADDLGQFIFQGYDGTSFLNGVQIRAGIDAAVSTGNMPGFISFLTNQGNERMRISSNGEVNVRYGATDNGDYPLQVNGQIFATNATIATSDEKYKENILPLSKGLEIVNKLKPVTFNFISDTENNFSQYEEVGFIAQDVDRALSTETFAKSIVKAADDSEPTSTMGLATQNLIPILVKAIQEQQILIKALEQRIINLENK